MITEEQKKIFEMLIPSDKELEILIDKLYKGEKLTFDDIVLIDKVKWINLLLQSKNLKI